MKPVTLVLGSGGARGLCFLGALQVLEEQGVSVGRVIGSSMGGLIGAAYCSGKPLEELEAAMVELKLRDFLRFRLRGPGLMSNRPFHALARRLVACERFEDLRTPLTVACTDLQRGESVGFNAGALLPPVVGSCLAAGFFEPVHHDGRYLVDGGYSDPVPVLLADQAGGTVVIDPTARPDWTVPIEGRQGLGSAFHLPRLWAQVLKSTDTLIFSLVQERLRRFPSIRIEPPLGGMRFTDFHLGRRAVTLGREATLEAISAIQAATGV